MLSPQPRAERACHTCRRHRVKCDRELPRCRKCIKRGQECLGYQQLLRWESGIASRGKMVGKTFEPVAPKPAVNDAPSPSSSTSVTSSSLRSSRGSTEVSSPRSLTDPLVQDVNPTLRKYLFYCELIVLGCRDLKADKATVGSHVCRDLVLYDLPRQNPFRELIALTHQHPILLQIIIANSALHMSNASQKALALDIKASPSCHSRSLLNPACPTTSTVQRSEPYKDALAARQRALHLLQSALVNLGSADVDVTLAVVLLFIEFELIDTGRDNWRHHINGAKTIIETLCGPNFSTQTDMSPLRSCLISNCLVFDILGSTLATSMGLVPSNTISTGAISLLRDAEGNHCSSFPAVLLQLVRTGAPLSQPEQAPDWASLESKRQKALLTLQTAQAFDPLAWATDLQSRSPAADLNLRAHVATAHRAAVCLYISRVLLSIDPSAALFFDPKALVTEIIAHLSCICPSDPLFTATTWPAFIAGAETRDPMQQKWVTVRFHELWDVEPWGLIKGGLGVLERVWAGKCRHQGGQGADDWIAELRGRGVDWLII